jgi:hypothetical protein
MAGAGWITNGAIYDADFANNRASDGALANSFTVTRAQTVSSYAENLDGSLNTYAANTLRLGGYGILIEPTVTNLMTQTLDLSQSPWASSSSGTGSAATATGAAGTAPDGTTTATKWWCRDRHHQVAPSGFRTSPAPPPTIV